MVEVLQFLLQKDLRGFQRIQATMIEFIFLIMSASGMWSVPFVSEPSASTLSWPKCSLIAWMTTVPPV